MVIKINIPNPELDWAKDIFRRNKQYFRFDKPRLYQDVICGITLDAINMGYKNIVIRASTGYGKSDMAIMIGEKFKEDEYYLLSANLGLTAQYRGDFKQLEEVKGRNNFPCLMKPGYTADRGPCVYRKKFKCDKINVCPYEKQKASAQHCESVISTPDYMTRVSRSAFPKRHIAIYDECHNLEQFFMRMIESYITENEYDYILGEPLPQYPEGDYWKESLTRVKIGCEKRLEREELLKDSEVEKIKNIYDRATTGIRLLAKDLKRCKIFFEKNKHGMNIVKFKPIKVNGLANHIMEEISDVRIFMSATIPSVEQFVFDLGLKSSDTLYINVTKNPFKIEHRLIHYTDVGYMTWKKKEETLPLIVEDIVKIIDEHGDERAVILPISHQNRKYIYKRLCELGYGDRVITHSADKEDRQKVIDKFLTEVHEPLILISTYITEGFNFSDILARWLYYVKVPFPDISDPIVEARLLLEQEEYRERYGCQYVEPENGKLCQNYSCGKCKRWYFCQAATKLEQGFGRIVRSENDFGSLYTGDKSFKRFVKNWGHLLSKPFKESIVWRKNNDTR